MLLTKTILLSLSILRRFAVTFPILLIGLFLYGALGGVIGFVIGLILPGTLFIATFLISASSGMIPIMVGARFGFQSKLIRPGVGYRKLIVPAIAYGGAESLAIGLILAPVVGLAFVQVAPNLVDLTKTPETPELDWLTSAGASVSVAGLVVTVAVFTVSEAAGRASQPPYGGSGPAHGPTRTTTIARFWSAPQCQRLARIAQKPSKPRLMVHMKKARHLWRAFPVAAKPQLSGPRPRPSVGGRWCPTGRR